MSDAISTNLRAVVPPVILEFAGEAGKEIVALREQVQRAEFAARLNAETLATTLRAHREEIDRYEEAIRTHVDVREKLRKLLSELDSAVVNVKNFGWVTLTAVLENGLYRDACPRCHEPSCEGCVPGHSDSLRDQTADFVIERWLRTWSQLV